MRQSPGGDAGALCRGSWWSFEGVTETLVFVHAVLAAERDRDTNQYCLLMTDHGGSISDRGSVTGWNVTSSIIKTFIKPQLTECHSVDLTLTLSSTSLPSSPPCVLCRRLIPPISRLPTLVHFSLDFKTHHFSSFLCFHCAFESGGDALVCAQVYMGIVSNRRGRELERSKENGLPAARLLMNYEKVA